jgi:transposase
MSLPFADLDPIPDGTARIAQAAFPKGSLAMTLRDRLGSIYHDGMFCDLYPPDGQPAIAPWRLALITVLQFVERLSDRHAVTMVRGRIDWKYALALPLEDPGFSHTVLHDFRERLVVAGAQERVLWGLLEVCREQGLLGKGGRQRTDSTRVLAVIRELNRLELVAETLRAALEALAVATPEWVREHIPEAWAEQYGRRIEESRLPKGEEARRERARAIGADGQTLLEALAAEEAPSWLRELPAVQVLQQVWAQQYHQTPHGLRFRATKDLPPASELIASPYDASVRWGKKRQQRWVGSLAHLTETDDADQPSLIVAVASTPASSSDQGMLQQLWQEQAEQDHLPAEQEADAGYLSAAALVEAAARGIDLVGPLEGDTSWQARTEEAYAARAFAVDWEAQQVTCPEGKQSRSWVATTDGREGAAIRVHFARAVCCACPARRRCTRSTTGGRTLTLLPTPEQDQARQAALERQQTAAFQEQYRHRAGIEGTISQAVRRVGLRQDRYLGEGKRHLQLCAEAAALNMLRLADWLDGSPRARTRQSHLCRALASAA